MTITSLNAATSPAVATRGNERVTTTAATQEATHPDIDSAINRALHANDTAYTNIVCTLIENQNLPKNQLVNALDKLLSQKAEGFGDDAIMQILTQALKRGEVDIISVIFSTIHIPNHILAKAEGENQLSTAQRNEAMLYLKSVIQQRKKKAEW